MVPTFLSQSHMSQEMNIRMSESITERMMLEQKESKLLDTEQEQEMMASRRNKS